MTSPRELTELINSFLAQIPYPAHPAELYSPIRYTLETGGKRLRPILMLSVIDALGGDVSQGLSQAAAIEIFHNFTLVHDDVMDNAQVRRGRPTVFHKWGRDTAILSGDTMLTLAYEYMTSCPDNILRPLLELFNRTAIEVYEGQQLDMEFENRDDVSVDEYIHMIRLKTSVLLACACEIGAIVAGASEQTRKAFYSYGTSMGLAFQLRDDYLDTYGDPLIFGKQIGGDIINDKKTWLYITALNEDVSGELKRIIASKPDSQNKIEAVCSFYDSLNLPERICSLIEQYTEQAVKSLNSIEIKPGWKEYFTSLATDLNKRSL